jgi:hypothetical protein
MLHFLLFCLFGKRKVLAQSETKLESQLQAALVIRGFDYLLTKKQLKTANNEGEKVFNYLMNKLAVLVLADYELLWNVTPENSEGNL